MYSRPWELFSGCMNPVEANYWKLKIHENCEWSQPLVSIFGKKHLVPRKTIFIGDKGINYRYSGVKHEANGWPPWFTPLLEKVCFISKNNFNGCLVNLYRNGNDRMGWHADNEKELIPNKIISSLSLGASRDFIIKHRNLPLKDKITLKNGDLLIMYPKCQEEWIHSVPSRKKIADFRINLTFRCYR
tara:strand:- start:212 stop:772 length:561 start_codon:yes stop_codon:yes gene_type:complete